MQRPCDCCGKDYEAKKRTSQFCSPKCRVRASRERRATEAPAAPPPRAQQRTAGVAARLEEELRAADKLDSSFGQAALVLASRIDGRLDSGSAVASMVKEMRATVEAVLADQPPAEDPFDEIARAREERLKRQTGHGA